MKINRLSLRLMRMARNWFCSRGTFFMAGRKRATATQLAEMIERQLGHSATIVVYPHERLGFVASGMTGNGAAIATQLLVEAIVATLRTRYELAE